MNERFPAPPTPPLPTARKVGRSAPIRSAHTSPIGARVLSKPERIYLSGMGWSAMAVTGAIGFFAMGGLGIVASAGCFMLGLTKMLDGRLSIREYFDDQIDHASAVTTEQQLDIRQLQQDLADAHIALNAWRTRFELMATAAGAEGDELCGESPSARNVVPFRRVH